MSLFAWQVFEENKQAWEIIAMAVPPNFTATLPLVTSHREIATQLRPIALQHGHDNGKPVRLVGYENPLVIERHG